MNAPIDQRPIQSQQAASAEDPPLAPSLERRRLQAYLMMVLGDVAALFIGFAVSGQIYFGDFGFYRSLLLAQLVLPVYLTIALYNASYSISALQSQLRSMVRSITALLISSAAVVFIAFYTKSTHDFSRVSFTLGVMLSASLLIWLRLQTRAFVAMICGPRVINELVIDDGGPAVDLPDAIHVSARSLHLRPDLDDPHALDRIGLALRNMDRVVISCIPKRRASWAIILKGANVVGEVIDETVAALGAQGARIAGGVGWLLVSTGPLGLRSRALKRCFDLVLAGTALLALAPLLAVIAIIIFLEDRGPIFFIQQRMGLGNRFFNMYKFRSMTTAGGDARGSVSTARNDARVTRIGKFIRRTSIDELPQLINVILGDMSLVGPRPHAIGSQAGDKLFWEIDIRYWQRHALKPGLTGLAQIRGLRGATEHEADLAGRLNSDLEYLNGWSLWRDLAIIFSTVGVLVHDRAY